MYQTVYNSRSTALNPTPLSGETLIIGGGIVGITVALELARGNVKTVIVEKGDTLGGSAGELRFFYDRQADAGKWLKETIASVEVSANIRLLKGSKLKRLEGQMGSFKAIVGKTDGEEQILSPAAIVVATGCITRPADKTADREGMISSSEMERLLSENSGLPSTKQGKTVSKISFLLDRTDEDIKIHTAEAIKQASIVQERGCQAYVIARDLKVSVHGMERLYRQAREKGVLFFKYDDPPVLSLSGDGIHVQLPDLTVLRKEEQSSLDLLSDLVVIGDTFSADPEMEALCRVMKLRLGTEGMLMDDNPQLQRILSNRRGIFVAGGCRFPQVIGESLIEARAVVQEVSALLCRGNYTPVNPVAEVDPKKCAVCYSCVRLCPHAAAGIERYGERNVYAAPGGGDGEMLWGAARIEPAACFGCGVCVAECPARAITLYR
jgi:heterodisulfide reductase subunit A